MTSATRMRVALFGSPPFAVEVLHALARRHDVVLAVAQPDKPAGRGLELRPPPVAAAAKRLGIPLAQPRTLRRNATFRDELAATGAEVAVTAAYGKILPGDLLAVPREGFLNVHASLLPRYRGAAPVQWALIRGEEETGVTIMQTDEGLDTGPIRLQRALEIGPHQTAADLFPALAALGVEALLEALELLAAGELPSRPQGDDEATHAPLLDRDDGRLVWERAAQASYDRYRGVYVWPGTWFVGDIEGTGGRARRESGARRRGAGDSGARHSASVKVHAMRPAGGARAAGQPGEVLAVRDDGVMVATAAGVLRLIEVQPAGRGRMDARAWANGYGVGEGVVLA